MHHSHQFATFARFPVDGLQQILSHDIPQFEILLKKLWWLRQSVNVFAPINICLHSHDASF